MGGGEGFLDATNADGIRKGVVAVLCQKIELIAEVFQVVIDRRGRE